jgi:hypothetical protein
MPIDTSPRPAAPKTPARKPARAPARAPAVAADKTTARQEALSGIGKLATALLVMKGSYADAGAVAQHGPNVSRETALLAESNEKIASVVDYLTEAGPYMGLISAILPLALQLAANHNRLDASKLSPEFGVLPPDVLEKRIRAEVQEERARLEREMVQARAASEERMKEYAAQNGTAS